MHFYNIDNHIVISEELIPDALEISKEELNNRKDNIFLAYKKDPLKYRSLFKIVNEDILNYASENVKLFQREKNHLDNYPNWLKSAILEGRAYFINTSYPNWHCFLDKRDEKKRYKIHIVGLGDVGGILATGLKILGNDIISSLGVYDKDENKAKRWKYELSAIKDVNSLNSPEVKVLEEDEIFNCDMFVFCVSVGVPAINAGVKDVRMAQFQGNQKIISYYAKKARENNFQGVFAVVSDPVDLLCKAVFLESNKNSKDEMDFKGIPSHKIRGYGLGVMNARASYYAKDENIYGNYDAEGRVFGPHGEGLIVANSISNYSPILSEKLTEKTKTANLEVRATGFKPYIAPAISSGAISLIATLNDNWHYSCTFLGGIFMGCKSLYSNLGTVLEDYYYLPDSLYQKLVETERYLHDLY